MTYRKWPSEVSQRDRRIQAVAGPMGVSGQTVTLHGRGGGDPAPNVTVALALECAPGFVGPGFGVAAHAGDRDGGVALRARMASRSPRTLGLT